jgi:hypothetical protein
MYGITPWLFNGMDPVLFIALVFLFISVRANKIATGAIPDKPASKKAPTNKNLRP